MRVAHLLAVLCCCCHLGTPVFGLSMPGFIFAAGLWVQDHIMPTERRQLVTETSGSTVQCATNVTRYTESGSPCCFPWPGPSDNRSGQNLYDCAVYTGGDPSIEYCVTYPNGPLKKCLPLNGTVVTTLSPAPAPIEAGGLPPGTDSLASYFNSTNTISASIPTGSSTGPTLAPASSDEALPPGTQGLSDFFNEESGGPVSANSTSNQTTFGPTAPSPELSSPPPVPAAAAPQVSAGYPEYSGMSETGHQAAPPAGTSDYLDYGSSGTTQVTRYTINDQPCDGTKIPSNDENSQGCFAWPVGSKLEYFGYCFPTGSYEIIDTEDPELCAVAGYVPGEGVPANLTASVVRYTLSGKLCHFPVLNLFKQWVTDCYEILLDPENHASEDAPKYYCNTTEGTYEECAPYSAPAPAPAMATAAEGAPASVEGAPPPPPPPPSQSSNKSVTIALAIVIPLAVLLIAVPLAVWFFKRRPAKKGFEKFEHKYSGETPGSRAMGSQF